MWSKSILLGFDFLAPGADPVIFKKGVPSQDKTTRPYSNALIA